MITELARRKIKEDEQDKVQADLRKKATVPEGHSLEFSEPEADSPLPPRELQRDSAFNSKDASFPEQLGATSLPKLSGPKLSKLNDRISNPDPQISAPS